MGSLNVSSIFSCDPSFRSLSPMYFGLSCAFASLSGDLGRESRELILKGTAQLLGLLVDEVSQRSDRLREQLAAAELATGELRARRVEDAKANAKVVSIFASREQIWVAERTKLRVQIETLAKTLRSMVAMKKKFDEESRARDQISRDSEDRLTSEDRRRLELEIREAVKRNEEAVDQAVKLSADIVRLEKEADQKDKILSAMLRKSKLDGVEKKAMLKEIKACKTKMKLGKEPNVVPDATVDGGHGPSKKDRRLRSLEEEEDDDCGGFRTEKLACEEIILLEQRHQEEIEAFTEQLKIKDEKLEGVQWRLMSAEIDAKQLLSHINGLGISISQLQEEKAKLKAIVEDQEKELNLLRVQLESSKKSGEVQEEDEEEEQHQQLNLTEDQWWSFGSTIQEASSSYSSKDVGEGKKEGLLVDMNHRNITKVQNSFNPDMLILCNESSSSSISSSSFKRSSSWKMDIHALGVSYKIKRLKQQLLVFENLTNEQATRRLENGDDHPDDNLADKPRKRIKALRRMISFLNKQVTRYQSLEEKTDELCRKMNENFRDIGSRHPHNGRTRDQIEALERFLVETFQLQRFMVATGQKLMDLESKLNSSKFFNETIEEMNSFNMSQFASLVSNLFREIQRGLEIRIARIIGDIEGTLASDGILYK